MNIDEFTQLIAPVIRHVHGRTLDPVLDAELNRVFPADGKVVQGVFKACQAAIAAGWMCKYEAGGLRYGRVIKPAEASSGFSVDVVDMCDLKGPEHRHPNGEIDLIMPFDAAARFDGRGAGWLVYGPGSVHSPTVSAGRALVLYLLPEGAIEFTKS